MLITGGSGKFGLRFIDCFLSKGDTVIFTASSESSVNSVLDRFGSHKERIFGFVSDFIDKDFSKKLILMLSEKKLEPDVLINNARSLSTLKVEDCGIVNRDNFVDEYVIDVVAPYELVMGLVNNKKCQLKSIVNISSQYGVVAANPQLYDKPSIESPIHYGVAKSALGHLTKELAVRLAAKEIKVNCIAFGGVEGRVNDDFKQRYERLTPIKRMLREDEIVGPVDFLLSSNSSGMTGQTIQVDGGWSIW